MSLRRSLRGQILTLLGGSLLLFLLITLACFNGLSGSIQSYRELVEGTLKASSLLDKANLELKAQVKEWKNTLLHGKDPTGLDKYWSQFETQEAKVQALLGQLQDKATAMGDGSLGTKVESLRNEHHRLGSAYRKGREAFLAAGSDPAAVDATVNGIDRTASEQMSALAAELDARSVQQSETIKTNAERNMSIGLLVMVLSSLVIGLFSLWLLNRSLINPIGQLIEHIAQLSQGNFERRTDASRQDELGRLALAANTLRDFLSDIFNRLKRSTTDLDNTSGELNTIASLMAQGIREQFSRTDQVATAMHEMSATAQEVARHAAEAAGAANQADQSARQGGAVMQATIQSITGMRSEIANTAEVIRRLESDSGRIGKVLEVIRGIAEQTNLLALNAAIEAARAGEQGRGFAVVADEVRTLAQRTAESTAEIHQIIDTVQTGALNAVRAIESGQNRSEESVSQVTEAGAMLQRITQAVEAIRDMNRQIATAAEEQTSVAGEISMNLSEITSIASTNETHAQRTQDASQRLHDLSHGLNQLTTRPH